MMEIIQINWANTPGGLYAIAYCLCCLILVLNSPMKFGKLKTTILTLGFGVVLFAVMSLTHGVGERWFIPLMLLYFALMWINIYVVSSSDAVTTLYFAMRAFIMGEFVASAEWLVYYYVITGGVAKPTELSLVVTVVVIDGLLFGLLFHLERRNKKVNEMIKLNYREWISAALIAVAIFSISNMSYIFNTANISPIIITQLFIVRTLVDLGGVAILYAYHLQLGELNARYEVERLQDILEMQTQNYEILEQSVNAINQKYHDLKYQIAVLKEDYGSKKSLSYIEQMEDEIKAYEAQNKTGNKILDTILTGKSLYCQKHWIELTSVADGKELNFMDPIDISTLFGNMLDNAIESVSKIERKERRLIHLAITRQKGFVRIRMENCYDKRPEFEDGLPITTKKDKKYHGFGMKSIKNIVKKYGGSTTIKAENGWFELRILIPIQ